KLQMLRSIGIIIGRTNVVGFWSKIWRRLFGQPFSKNNPLQRGRCCVAVTVAASERVAQEAAAFERVAEEPVARLGPGYLGNFAHRAEKSQRSASRLLRPAAAILARCFGGLSRGSLRAFGPNAVPSPDDPLRGACACAFASRARGNRRAARPRRRLCQAT